MEYPQFEYVSSLLDEACCSTESADLSRLMQDEQAQQRWYEYHLIRDCLHNDHARLGMDLSAGFAAKWQAEAPLQAVEARPPQVASNQSVFKGFAVAASVLAVSVAVWQLWPVADVADVPAPMAATQQPAAVTQAAITPVAVPVKSLAQSPAVVGAVYSGNLDEGLNNPYLQAHQQEVGNNALIRTSASLQEAPQ